MTSTRRLPDFEFKYEDDRVGLVEKQLFVNAEDATVYLAHSILNGGSCGNSLYSIYFKSSHTNKEFIQCVSLKDAEGALRILQEIPEKNSIVIRFFEDYIKLKNENLSSLSRISKFVENCRTQVSSHSFTKKMESDNQQPHVSSSSVIDTPSTVEFKRMPSSRT